MKRLSSAMPHLHTIVILLAGVPLVLAVAVTILVFGIRGASVGVAVVPLIVLLALLLLRARSMCDVWLDGDDMVVTKRSVTARIPLSDVVSVSEGGLGANKDVYVRVKKSTDVGSRFTFSAEGSGSSVGKCEAARILRQRVRRAIGNTDA